MEITSLDHERVTRFDLVHSISNRQWGRPSHALIPSGFALFQKGGTLPGDITFEMGEAIYFGSFH